MSDLHTGSDTDLPSAKVSSSNRELDENDEILEESEQEKIEQNILKVDEEWRELYRQALYYPEELE